MSGLFRKVLIAHLRAVLQTMFHSINPLKLKVEAQKNR